MEADENVEWEGKVSQLERSFESMRTVCGYLDDLITMSHERERDQSSKETPAESGRYPYIPFDRSEFTRMLLAVKQLYGEAFNEELSCAHCGSTVHRKRTFVDVGCGLADKVVLASKIGYEAHGIEVDPYLIRTVKQKYTFRECLDPRCSRVLPDTSWREDTLTLYPVDAMTFDYSGFDVIYFYRPFSSTPSEAALERRIWKQAKPGAYVIACSAETAPPPALGFREIKELDGLEIAGRAALYLREAATGRKSGGRRRSAKEDDAKKDDAKEDDAKEDDAPRARAKKRKRGR